MAGHTRFFPIQLLPLLLCAASAGCSRVDSEAAVESAQAAGAFDQVGLVQHRKLDEISGMVMLSDRHIAVINDGGKPRVHILGVGGQLLASIRAEGAKNRDWEDLAWVIHDGRKMLIICDVGNNHARQRAARLYFLPWPDPADGSWPQSLDVIHRIDLSYPDGPRDTEAVAWDAGDDRLLLITKRDRPARIYSIDLGRAMANTNAELRYDGQVAGMRPPTAEDRRRAGKRAAFISQPTGMDISPDGAQAAIITYRSLYLYDRESDQGWLEAFMGQPAEIVGPPGWHQEGVAYSPDGGAVLVTTERLPAPIHRLPINRP